MSARPAMRPSLLVVPAGALTALPFHLLVTEKPAAAIPDKFDGYREAAWLLKRQAVSGLPSGGLGAAVGREPENAARVCAQAGEHQADDRLWRSAVQSRRKTLRRPTL